MSFRYRTRGQAAISFGVVGWQIHYLCFNHRGSDLFVHNGNSSRRGISSILDTPKDLFKPSFSTTIYPVDIRLTGPLSDDFHGSKQQEY
ncbi:hypothetical protein V2G26_009279 [Clonostachys chloroleuca]